MRWRHVALARAPVEAFLDSKPLAGVAMTTVVRGQHRPHFTFHCTGYHWSLCLASTSPFHLHARSSYTRPSIHIGLGIPSLATRAYELSSLRNRAGQGIGILPLSFGSASIVHRTTCPPRGPGKRSIHKGHPTQVARGLANNVIPTGRVPPAIPQPNEQSYLGY